MLLQMARFHSFLCLVMFHCVYIYIYIYIYIYVHTTSSVSIHLLVDTGCFHILVVVNNAAVNIRVHIYLSSYLLFLFSSGEYLKVELLDHMVVLFLIFGGISILFSIVVAPSLQSQKQYTRVSFLYILISIYLLSFFFFCLL